jgi:hypothetical protein
LESEIERELREFGNRCASADREECNAMITPLSREPSSYLYLAFQIEDDCALKLDTIAN